MIRLRCLPLILATGLLSAGLLAGPGPAHAAMPTLTLDRSAVADTAVKRLPTTTDTPGDIIAVATAVAITVMAMVMATTDLTTATATEGPIMVMDMGVAGATETRHPIAG